MRFDWIDFTGFSWKNPVVTSDFSWADLLLDVRIFLFLFKF